MEAGASYPMALLRLFLRLAAVVGAIAYCACLPAGADASVSVSGAQAVAAAADAAGTVAPSAEDATESVAKTVGPAAGAVTAPAPDADPGPVEQVVAPVNDAAGAAAPAAVPPATQVTPGQGEAPRAEGARAHAARIAGAASIERLRARQHDRQSSHGVARQRPSGERSVSLPGAAPDGARAASTARDAAATPVRPSPEPSSGAAGDAPAAGGFASFLFGGALALLVATLLPASPRLRRRLSLPPAVCRPAAFLVVLERPG
jgi:hypothetical protein